MTSPTVFYDVADAALSCICAAMDDLVGADGVPGDYGGCPCYLFVSAGEPSLDCCLEGPCEGSGGMLAVHVEDTFASDEFPNPTATFEPCKAQTWVARLVVTVARCAPSTDEQGNPSSAEDLSANALLMAVDQYAVMTALSCCLVEDAPPGKRKRRVQIEGSRPLVSEGGCSAVEVRVLVEAGVVCNCPQGS